jgi:hypothetical protein
VTCVSCGHESSLKNFGKQWGANCQNLTPRFKKYVKPGPGRKFVVYDYSQIELRVAAELILQENPHATDALVKAFRDGLDPHSLTGEEVTGIPYAEFYRRAVTDKEPDMVRLRRGMKVVNFGATFGFGPAAMAVKIYVDVEDTTPFGQKQIDAAQNGWMPSGGSTRLLLPSVIALVLALSQLGLARPSAGAAATTRPRGWRGTSSRALSARRSPRASRGPLPTLPS